MNKLQNRDFNIMDGEYANVPDYHIHDKNVLRPPERFIGLREFNNGVLIHNWFEERNKFEKKELPNTSTYQLDYKSFPGTVPDTVVRRKLIGASQGVGPKNLIGHHNFESEKNMITWYDELINKRQRPEPEMPVGQKFPPKRHWNITNDRWLPEKTDHPLLGSPTKWGLIEQRNERIRLEKDKYLSQLPDITEYKDRFQTHSANCYLQTNTMGVPKELSTSLYELNTALNNTTKPRQQTSSLRQPQTRDVLDVVYSKQFTRPKNIPRTLYYLGKVPTDGSSGVYRARDFETLMPPADYDQVAHEKVRFLPETTTVLPNTEPTTTTLVSEHTEPNTSQ